MHRVAIDVTAEAADRTDRTDTTLFYKRTCGDTCLLRSRAGSLAEPG